MIKNYFLISWRSLKKNKLFSLINIFGLGLSMSIGVLVLIRVSDAFEYDNFHNDRNSIYRVVSKITNPQGDSWTFASTPLPLSSALVTESPGDILVTRIYPDLHTIIKDESREFDFNGVFIEPAFFEIFNFELAAGSPSSLAKANTLLLSEEFARKFFGDADPMGRVVSIGTLGEFEVAGIIKTPPAKSHIKFDVFVSIQSVPSSKLESWDSFKAAYTYVKTSSTDDLTNRLALLAASNSSATEDRFEFDLQPLTSISPAPSDIYNDIGRSPSRGSLMAEMGIVLVILIAACFNYTNLSIARALTRGKEIGVRKLSGATRLQIISQYVMEALLISLMSVLVANFILAPILEYKPFNNGYEMIPDFHMSWQLVGLVGAFTLFTALMAGLFPAWLLSSFQPVRVLRGIATEKLMGHMSLRKVLLVFQFSLSMIVLVFLTTFYKQFDFLANADQGFNKERIALVSKGNNARVTADELNNVHGIKAVGFTSARFGGGSQLNISRENKSVETVAAEYYSCDKPWVEMMQLHIVAGTTAIQRTGDVIVNEKAIAALGFSNSEQAVGSIIYMQDSLKVSVIGVVRDFYTKGYGNPVRPLVLQSDATAFKLITIEADQESDNITAEIKRQWSKQNPAHSFDLVWLDEQMNKQNDQMASVSLLGFLGFVTLTIASLGLLGLVVYTVEVRRKEISIRKIVGASVSQLITLLSVGFLSLLAIAGLIALPVGYLFSELFLMNFVNRIGMSWIQPFGCFTLLLSIGLITILSQTFGAAAENPAKNLRSE